MGTTGAASGGRGEQDPVREAPAPREPSLRDRSHRVALFGIVLVVSVVAVEAMSVATVMPTAVHALHGLRLYGWAFTAFFLADIVGIVDAGRRCDRGGPSLSLIGGLALFAVGLVVASSAPNMSLFILGRGLQGLGAGSQIVAVYVVVARALPGELQPRAFAALSAAWIVPSLVGPLAAGAVAEAVGWRWVFIGIAPLAGLGALILVPVLRGLPAHAPSHSLPARLGPLGGVFLAGGLGMLQDAGTHLNWSGGALAAGGVALALPPLRRLLPAGALRLARGLPTVVMLRGALTAAYLGAEAYLPLTLTRLHHGAPAVVGIPLTLGALGWAAGSWFQGHRAGDDRSPLLQWGFGLVGAGVALLASLATTTTSLWLAAPIWVLAGAGMGLAYPTVSVLTLQLSAGAEQGANSAALQVTDVLGSVLAIAAGAGVIDSLSNARFSTAIAVIDVALATVAVGGMLASRRALPRTGAAV